MRRYDEPVQVQTARLPGHHEGEVPPRRFIWQGRVYDVDTVHDRWVIRQSWWRRALAPDGGVWALDPQHLEEHVWRVTAAARGSVGTGVYDLAHGRGWRLLHVDD
ncbi:DUF6504 family protein [Mobilicoccus pelagius]|uniref:DUF6504 domain-containing protein n=1 Tax=Mobilicoccus pelagius NBRC 104925 TaxID=1089455 RepID=H5UUR6_9MICO|nr:DUF6504 family protein [Mobilicoccus pelagius]GAB49474.1 hypothetical protein MOPEL_130_00810 [Mobilicoccus pelagius NBRC 104925]